MVLLAHSGSSWPFMPFLNCLALLLVPLGPTWPSMVLYCPRRFLSPWVHADAFEGLLAGMLGSCPAPWLTMGPPWSSWPFIALPGHSIPLRAPRPPWVIHGHPGSSWLLHATSDNPAVEGFLQAPPCHAWSSWPPSRPRVPCGHTSAILRAPHFSCRIESLCFFMTFF